VKVLTGLELSGARAAVMAWVEACRGLCKGWIGVFARVADPKVCDSTG
jgi:hypothetical protein